MKNLLWLSFWQAKKGESNKRVVVGGSSSTLFLCVGLRLGVCVSGAIQHSSVCLRGAKKQLAWIITSSSSLCSPLLFAVFLPFLSPLRSSDFCLEKKSFSFSYTTKSRFFFLSLAQHTKDHLFVSVNKFIVLFSHTTCLLVCRKRVFFCCLVSILISVCFFYILSTSLVLIKLIKLNLKYSQLNQKMKINA
ncbi:unnamed protein product [Orchesella dallaii]|uniref:Transmembrane protein n=1 Tax=Orchesella dallaii TaxID=48710 RepID=A0ABP1S3U4_9HEXA